MDHGGVDAFARTGRLSGRRVLVTGASSGIGAATARALAADGARVAVLARRAALLEELAGSVGGVAVPADVTDPAAVLTAATTAADRLGGLDGLVAAAGVVRPTTVADGDPEQWRELVEVNLLGTLHATRAVVEHLRGAGGGDVVLLSSMSGRRLLTPELGVYAATKAGVRMLAEGLRRELADDGIRVTVLAPGLVDTPMLDGRDDPVSVRLRTRAAEVGLRADDVAAAVVDVLAAPPHVVHAEVALVAAAQERRGQRAHPPRPGHTQ